MHPQAVAIAIGLAALGIAAGAERLHARRAQTLGPLAFGPTGAPRPWTGLAGIACPLAAGLLAWGLATTAMLEPEALGASGGDVRPEEAENLQRVIILLDVSPSMSIVDSGPQKNQSRRDRVRDVSEAIFQRIALGRTRLSVVAFFTAARPVVVDTADAAVVRNVIDSLPLVYSFKPGQTQLLEGVRVAGELARDWPPESTTLLVCTDGDTVDFTRVPPLPRSIHRVEILGVGDPLIGTYIDRHDSRQQAGILRRLAAEMHGSFYDVNQRHMPTAALGDLSRLPPPPPRIGLRLKDVALLAVILGTLVVALMPVALEYFGSAWNSERELPRAVEKAAADLEAVP